ncbi:hypothetical protein H1D32_10080 [Anaerobacillus sp. CMMVII]|uniref:hypothetical protein n=1 Tax=Anaerobacillus sp. CMMVII TaxID=2755588 RepID=UPI0021B7B9E5|nr:hypothetical protein [Anaerobacillus sp. CMMVII]MCT8138073.1 hypothetical protein [Anaerobacillus sp. CMMVII]
MKNIIMLTLLLLFLGSLIACSDQTAKVEDPQEDILDVVRIKEKMDIGLTEIEIESLLGSEYTKVKALMTIAYFGDLILEQIPSTNPLMMNMILAI